MVRNFNWDKKTEALNREGHLRDTTMHVLVGLREHMEEIWGHFTHVKTATDVQTGEVAVAKSDPSDPNAVPFNTSPTGSSGFFSFLVPLRKLRMELAEDRQLNVTPYLEKDSQNASVLVFPMLKGINVPRNTREDREVQQIAEEVASLDESRVAIADEE